MLATKTTISYQLWAILLLTACSWSPLDKKEESSEEPKSCDEIEDEASTLTKPISKEYDVLQICETDDDCILTTYITAGCYTLCGSGTLAINKNKQTDYDTLDTTYHEKTKALCNEFKSRDCPVPDAECSRPIKNPVAKCQASRCNVEAGS